ncbi:MULTISPECIES: NADPH-dependent FMN reductase [Flavobacterium]|uniref:NADPH-dependent FMN reductase n=1 Tax=Flavobacterium TaxID=237 RepID=UPI001FCC1E7E|nr:MULTISPECIES: NAD(P)H-dependent oxidoreductase [Flavobacterium]UOK41956.1 NAD(P)H-dependent oxidoreductase [Flavobacterium enshiense]
MKIIAFGGSISKNSINKKLATYVSHLFEHADVEVLDLNDFAMPVFSVDLEKEIVQHPLAQAFLDKIASAELLVISMAENNGNYSAAFKNTFDWASRINVKVFQGKPMLLMATSDGARGGARVLEIAQTAFPRYGANIIATFSFPKFYDNFDMENMKISDSVLDNQIRDIVKNLSF